jgi:transcriptional regulator with XRE-family HTH domain
MTVYSVAIVYSDRVYSQFEVLDMPEKPHTYSRLTEEAVLLLGSQIKLARKMRRMSERELAGRAGIARSTLQKIEQGDPTVNIGLAFEAATIAGVPLFVADASTLVPKLDRLNETLALMPKQIRRKRREVKDDF